MQTLREALENTPTALLREMAVAWEVADADKAGRPGLSTGLLARMAEEEAVQFVLRKLDRQERDLLRQLLAAGGRLPAATLTHTYGQLRSANLAPSDWAALNPLERLHRRGLLFRAYSAWEGYRGPAFFVPAELWPFLPRVPRTTPEDLLRPLPPGDVEVIPSDFSMHRDIATLLALFRRAAHPVNEKGQCPTGLQALQELLMPFPAYVTLLIAVARQARLLAPDIEGMLRPTAEGQQWLRAGPGLRAQVLFQAWREHPTWDDLAAIPELIVERVWPADLSLARGRALHHLAACPPETWLAQANWAQVIEAVDPEFLRPTATSSRPRVRSREDGSSLEGVTSWNEVEGRYLRFLLQGPLQWLGVVEVGESPTQGTAFRFTPLGQALLHPEAGLPPMSEEPAIVEGTFEVWVPREASPYIVFLLENCAERVQQDHVSRYQLTRPALHRSLQRGERLETLLEALGRYGRGEVPQNVLYTLREWAATYGQFHLSQPILLTATDALLLDEVLADPLVRAACEERLSPTTVGVVREKVAALEEQLAHLGYLPEVGEGIIPHGERLTLRLTTGQGTALLALLWAWAKEALPGDTGRIVADLAEELAQRLSPAAQDRARRLQERIAAQVRPSTADDDAPKSP
jgi:hypothetical protein